MFRYVIVATICILSCEQPNESGHSPYASIEDPKIRSVLSQAIEKAGGISQWYGLDSMRYSKRSILYFADSTIESDVTDHHFYRFTPQFSAEISWMEDDDQHILTYYPDGIRKYVNDSLTTPDTEALSQKVMSAYYVLGMPYKLMDEGTKLLYKGETVLRNGVKVDVIQAGYDPDENENHSTSDLWWYFFSVEDGNFEGSMVWHPPTYALIENLSFVDTDPLLFHEKRKSYRVDSLRNVEYLRAAFEYWDYEVW